MHDHQSEAKFHLTSTYLPCIIDAYIDKGDVAVLELKITAKASKTSYLVYKCHQCGRTVRYEYVLEEQAVSQVPANAKAEKKERFRQKARTAATKKLERRDEKLFTAINRTHDYRQIYKQVQCPHCSQLQCWSMIPLPFWETNLFVLWLLLAVFFVCFAVFSLPNVVQAVTVFFIGLILLTLAPLVQYLRRCFAQKKVERMDFSPPVYYNQQNMPELLARIQPDGSVM